MFHLQQIEAVKILENNSYLYNNDQNLNNSQRRGSRLRKKPEYFDQSVLNAPQAASENKSKEKCTFQRKIKLRTRPATKNLILTKKVSKNVSKNSPQKTIKTPLGKAAISSTPLPGIRPQKQLSSRKAKTQAKDKNRKSIENKANKSKRQKIQEQKLSNEEKNRKSAKTNVSEKTITTKPTKTNVKNRYTQSSSQGTSSKNSAISSKSNKKIPQKQIKQNNNLQNHSSNQSNNENNALDLNKGKSHEFIKPSSCQIQNFSKDDCGQQQQKLSVKSSKNSSNPNSKTSSKSSHNFSSNLQKDLKKHGLANRKFAFVPSDGKKLNPGSNSKNSEQNVINHPQIAKCTNFRGTSSTVSRFKKINLIRREKKLDQPPPDTNTPILGNLPLPPSDIDNSDKIINEKENISPMKNVQNDVSTKASNFKTFQRPSHLEKKGPEMQLKNTDKIVNPSLQRPLENLTVSNHMVYRPNNSNNKNNNLVRSNTSHFRTLDLQSKIRKSASNMSSLERITENEVSNHHTPVHHSSTENFLHQSSVSRVSNNTSGGSFLVPNLPQSFQRNSRNHSNSISMNHSSTYDVQSTVGSIINHNQTNQKSKQTQEDQHLNSVLQALSCNDFPYPIFKLNSNQKIIVEIFNPTRIYLHAGNNLEIKFYRIDNQGSLIFDESSGAKMISNNQSYRISLKKMLKLRQRGFDRIQLTNLSQGMGTVVMRNDS